MSVRLDQTRRTVQQNPTQHKLLSCRIVKINDCCFKPLSIDVVYFAAKADTNFKSLGVILPTAPTWLLMPSSPPILFFIFLFKIHTLGICCVSSRAGCWKYNEKSWSCDRHMHRQFQLSVTTVSTYCQERTWNRYITQIRVSDKTSNRR